MIKKIFFLLLSKILHAANSDVTRPFWFYGIKDRILKRFGRRIAWDQQHIVKKCWSCVNGKFSGFDNGYDWVPMPEQPCYRCCGTGIYDEFWVLLEVWHLGAHEFHRPVQRIRKGEYFTAPNGWTSIWCDFRKKIEGKITHIHHPRARAAFWTLATVFTPGQVLVWVWKWRIYYGIHRRTINGINRLRHRFKIWIHRDEEIPF
ncbi:hypothetical protein [Desulfospira joergensenii]|uniref:hypothetical protein n=1 Tax=Desulfospira joergensenii TaxID=53329 RepID=UPI0003B6A5D4|nr:hypothetical protein [Desulfospira joergensenii]